MAPIARSEAPPKVSAADTVDAIVGASKRTRYFPVRREFVQRIEDDQPKGGPLSALVASGDSRALQLYLLLLTKASSEPWDAALPAAVWARALDLALPESKTARSTVSKIWARLDRHKLVARSRQKRWADVTLLREDGTGSAYASPGAVGDRYIRVPLALWQEGPDDEQRWYQVLGLAELAVLLVGRSLRDGFWLPFERASGWYSISADTLSRGVEGLKRHGLIDVVKTLKAAPLSPVGYTEENRYTLLKPFGPVVNRATEGAAAGALRQRKRATAGKLRQKKGRQP